MKKNNVILLIEDNPLDIKLVKEAINEIDVSVVIETANDLKSTKHFFKKNIYPDLIILDLHLPGRSGLTVLEYLTDTFLCLPIIVFSTQNDPYTIKEVYKNYANSYIKKPIDYNTMVNTMKIILDYWFNIVELPERC